MVTPCDHVAEFDLAGLFRENRDVVRIPLDEGLALLDLAAVGNGNDRADDDGVALEFAAVLGMDGDRAVLVEDDDDCRRATCTVRRSL